MELGCCKYPPALYITPYWYANRDPLLKYIELVHTTGIRGFVVDEKGRPLEGARVIVENRAKKIKTYKDGDFWRLLVPGNYTIRVAKRRYKNTKLRVTVNPNQATVVNITLLSKKANLNNHRPVKINPIPQGKVATNISFHPRVIHRDKLRLSVRSTTDSASMTINPSVPTSFISIILVIFLF